MLRVNVDETAIQRNAHGRKGIVMSAARRHHPVLLTKKAAERGTLTHVAFICDDTALQPHMPQVIICNEHTLTKAQLEAASAIVPSNVWVCRAKSSWVDAATFAAALGWLARATMQVRASHRVIVLLDCCPVHLHPLVRAAARRHRMYLCYVPTGMTWLLQPCDTHVFRKYKNCLRNLFAEEQVRQRMHALDTLTLVKLLCQAVLQVLQGNRWGAAFDHNGYGQWQAEVSDRVGKVVDLPAIQAQTRSPCTADDVRLVLPKGLTYDARILQSWSEAADTFAHSASQASQPSVPALRPHHAAAASRQGVRTRESLDSQHPTDTPEPEEDWLCRLRPRNRTAASSSTAPPPLPPPAEHAPRSLHIPPCPSLMPRLRRLPSAPQTLPRREHATP